MQVKTTFVNSLFTEKGTFMNVTKGLKCETNNVCKLNKTVYDIK